FNFGKYPKLNAKTVELISTYCPNVFTGKKFYTFLLDPRFCDHWLVVQGVEIPINRWFIQNESGLVKDLFDEFGYDTGRTELNFDVDIDAQLVQDGFNCLYNYERAERSDRQQLADLLRMATYFDMPQLVKNIDATLVSRLQANLVAPVEASIIQYIKHIQN